MDTLIETKELKTYFPVQTENGHQIVKAVDGVSLTVCSGETVGLVGESGCGKSTLGRTILGLAKRTSGQIWFQGQRIDTLSDSAMKPFRKEMQIIFQDPFAALNPRKSIFDLVKAPLDAFHEGSASERKERVRKMLDFVGIGDYQYDKYPHELSGGQRQRVVIARAMILKPKFVVCDEAVSALDVSIRAQVLNLMKDLQKETGVAYLFISHDMSVVHYLCDRIAVMYLGRIVEEGTKKDIFDYPCHPYTRALLSAIPRPEVGAHRQRILLKGDVPSPLAVPKGCRFHTRCPFATAACATMETPLCDIGSGHCAACPVMEQPFKERSQTACI